MWVPTSLAFWCTCDVSYIDQVGVSDDCPIFDGLFQYCSISAGGSLGKLSEDVQSERFGRRKGQADIDIISITLVAL